MVHTAFWLHFRFGQQSNLLQCSIYGKLELLTSERCSNHVACSNDNKKNDQARKEVIGAQVLEVHEAVQRFVGASKRPREHRGDYHQRKRSDGAQCDDQKGCPELCEAIDIESWKPIGHQTPEHVSQGGESGEERLTCGGLPFIESDLEELVKKEGFRDDHGEAMQEFVEGEDEEGEVGPHVTREDCIEGCR